MPHNRATIYSNGIADFQRIFPVKGNQANKISIPVRQQHLGDVLASLTISGSVKIESPPSYQPANQDEGNIHISVDNALVDLAMQLAGAEVEVVFGQSTASGRLLGVHKNQVATGGQPAVERSLVVQTESGISRVAIPKVETLKFVDPAIQAEIDKALSLRLRAIKPNSTFVDLELSTAEDSTDAIIQYTIPAAAWKISFRVLVDSNGQIEFHGHAFVDNNTDEDWNDFVISVVMGQPITFTTDLADSKTPARSHVNIVQGSALGAVEIEESLDAVLLEDSEPVMYAAGGSASEPPRRMRKAMKRMAAPAPRKESAVVDQAEVAESGDFCIFESANPVSIAAHRSAVIPVFATELDQSKPVLHFATENHAERPFRALKFRNTTTHSLGRGVCTVYDGTTYAGSCILPATKPDADALLPHALETAVKVRCKSLKTKIRKIGLQINDGIGYESRHQTAVTEYHIQSSRDAAFQFLLDHSSRIKHGKVAVQIERAGVDPVEVTSDVEELKTGRRLGFSLEAKDRLVVRFTETTVAKSSVALTRPSYDDADFRVVWLYDNLLSANASLIEDPAVSRCLELQKTLDENQLKQSQAQKEIERLTKRQERLRKNIKTGSADQQNARWMADLGQAEDSIVELEETALPKLRAEHEEIRRQLFDALKSLAIEWQE